MFTDLNTMKLVVVFDTDIVVVDLSTFDLPFTCIMTDVFEDQYGYQRAAIGSFTSDGLGIVTKDGQLWIYEENRNCFTQSAQKFPFSLGSYLTAFDSDGDGIDEIVGFDGHLKKYRYPTKCAVNLSVNLPISNCKVDCTIDGLAKICS